MTCHNLHLRTYDRGNAIVEHPLWHFADGQEDVVFHRQDGNTLAFAVQHQWRDRGQAVPVDTSVRPWIDTKCYLLFGETQIIADNVSWLDRRQQILGGFHERSECCDAIGQFHDISHSLVLRTRVLETIWRKHAAEHDHLRRPKVLALVIGHIVFELFGRVELACVVIEMSNGQYQVNFQARAFVINTLGLPPKKDFERRQSERVKFAHVNGFLKTKNRTWGSCHWPDYDSLNGGTWSTWEQAGP